MNQKTIGEFTYTLLVLPATEQLDLLPRIAPLAGIVQMVMTGDYSAPSLKGLSDAFPPGTLGMLAKVFAARTTVASKANPEGVPLASVFDTHFGGDRFSDLFEWLMWVLEVHYADFFRGVFAKMIGLLTSKNSGQATLKTE